MNVNFEINQWFDKGIQIKYELKNIKNKKYLCYDPKSKDYKDLSFTLEDYEIATKAMIDILNIGKVIYYKENENIEELILSFANTYGLCGFMANIPINQFYVSENKIMLQEDNLMHKEKAVSILSYFKYFFPETEDEVLKERINAYRDGYSYNYMGIATRLDRMNDITITAKDYCEPIDMVKEYALGLYKTLVKRLESEDYDDVYYTDNISLGFKLNDKTTKATCMVNSLQKFIDMLFITHISQENMLLKTCKLCNKAFIAASQKQEYDDLKCKNRASIQSYRERQKEENK